MGDFLHKYEGGSGDKYHANVMPMLCQCYANVMPMFCKCYANIMAMLCLNLSAYVCSLQYVLVVTTNEALFHHPNQFVKFHPLKRGRVST